MINTWVIDLQHYVDSDGCLVDSLPARAQILVRFLGAVVGWVTSRPTSDWTQTNVPCRRSPGRRRCFGDIFAQVEPDTQAIRWECPICGDNGWIRGWADTEWDRREG
jgi:hypothetical protein